MLDRISVDPGACSGKPTIRGMRITVDFVLKLVGDGYTAAEIVELYPELEKDDVYQAMCTAIIPAEQAIKWNRR